VNIPRDPVFFWALTGGTLACGKGGVNAPHEGESVAAMWYPAGVRRAFVALLFALTSWGAWSAPAQAYEDRGTLGVEAGYGVVVITDTTLPQHGALFGLELSIGLGDQFAVRAHADYGYHPGEDEMHVALFGVEGLYLVDIVQVVPYFGIGIDGIATVYQDAGGLELGFHVVVGLEYLLSRSWLIGLDVRPHFLPITLSEGRTDPVYISTNLRVSWLFDF
jgi:hypothetical protein